jgi:hypothetical protein
VQNCSLDWERCPTLGSRLAPALVLNNCRLAFAEFGRSAEVGSLGVITDGGHAIGCDFGHFRPLLCDGINEDCS